MRISALHFSEAIPKDKEYKWVVLSRVLVGDRCNLQCAVCQ